MDAKEQKILCYRKELAQIQPICAFLYTLVAFYTAKKSVL